MSGQRGIGATRETDPRSSSDPSASEIAARADRRDGRSGASPTVRYDPAAVGPEPHAALAADCQAVFGNTTMRAALEGTDTGPASLMVDAMALGAAGVQAGQAVDQIQSNHHNQQALVATGGPSIAISARRKSMDPAEQASSIAVDTALKRGGKPLAPDVRADMERALGADLSGVRIHTDGAAAHAAESVSAHAFAVEQHVVFNRGTYRPHTTEGRRLLAHELQHVVQHQEGRIPAATEEGLSVSNPMDAHEREADRVAAEVVRTPMVDSTEAAPIDTEAGQDVQAGSADVAGPDAAGPDAAVSRKAQSGAVGMAQTAAGPEQFAQLQGSLTEQLQGLMAALQQVMDDNQEVRALFGEAAGAGGITGELQAVAKPFAEVMQTIQAAIAGVGIALPSGADGDMGGGEPGAEAAGGPMGGVSDLASGAMQGAGDAIAAATQMVGGGGTGPEGMPGMADLGTVLSKAQGEYKSVLGSLRGQEREVVSQILSAMDQIGGNLVQLNSMEALLKEGKDLIGNNAETASREAAGPIARAASFAPPTDSAGKSLPAATQAALALKLGKSVSRIRVHTGPNAARFAASLNANAVTVGQDIYFARGAWRPGSTEGEARIAHEAHHAIIGGGAPGVSQPGDAHEREASAFGDAFAADGGSRLLARVGQSPVTSIALAAQVQRRLDATPAPSPTYASFDGPDWIPSTATELSAPSVQTPDIDHQGAAPAPMSSAPEVAAPSTPAGDAAVWSREAAPGATSAAPSSQAGGTAQQAGPDPAAMAALLGQSLQAAEVAVEGGIEGKREARSTEEELEAANAEDESAAELEAAATEGEASAENGKNGENREGEAEPGAEGATGAPADAAAAAGGGDTPAPPPPGLSADSADGLVSAFKTATPTQKAYAWPTLGTDVGTRAVSEGQDISGNVPELNAEMSSTATAPQGDTAVASPGGESAVSVEPEGESVAPEIEATPAMGAFQATGSTPDYNAEDPDNAARTIGRAIGSVSTRDGSVPVSAGPAPTVPLQGATDPQQLADRLASSGQEGAQAAQAARQAVLDSPGAERVQLREVSEAFQVPELTMPSIEATEAQTDMERYVALGLPGDVQAAFDELNGPDMEANLAQAEADARAAASERDASVQTEIDQAQVDARAASEEAQRAQQGEVQRQRAEIDRARADTVSQQQQAVADVERRAASEHASRTSSINERVAADQARIRSEYASAESKARSEVAAGERKAAAEKRKKEQEAQNQSWWDRAKNFVASCIDALKKAVTAIFDAVRKAVTKVLDAVKSLAASIIDAAADFIKSAIRAFGELLKGWIDGLLGDIFPGLAEALNNLVDAAVEYAESKIDDLAEGLKEAINKLVDGLHAAINAVLSVYEAAISIALEVAEAVVTGDWTDLLLKALEAALRIAGINPDDFYAFVGKAEDTIKSIVDNPGGFIGNLLESVKGGFGQFADNFGTHLQSGFVEWLTGQAGDAGITMPSALDAKGIFSLVTQVLGLTKGDLKEKVEKHFGEKAGAAFEYVWDSVEALIEGGVEGLYDKIAGDLDGMVDQVMGEIKNWLITKVVMAAVMKVASMFNPVGAIVQAVMMAWKVYEFLHDQINRIYGVVTGIVNSIADIAAGALGGAMNRVEQALGDMVPVAIDLLAKLLGIGGMGKKVRKVIEKVQAKVDAAIDKLIERMKGLFSGGAQKEGETEQEGAEQQGDFDGQVGERKAFSAGEEGHTLWVETDGSSANVMVASTPMTVPDRLTNWESRLGQEPNSEEGLGGPSDPAQAQSLLGTARSQAGLVKTEAEETVATEGVDKAKNDSETEQAENQLVPTLKSLFELYQDDAPDLMERATTEGGTALAKYNAVLADGNAQGKLSDFEAGVMGRLAGGGGVYDAMKAEVAGDTAYICQGPKVSDAALRTAGGVSRVVDLPAIFNYHMPGGIRKEFDGNENAFAAAVNAGLFDPNPHMTGQMRGQLAQAWWFARNTAPSYQLAELIDQLAINESPQYQKGAIRFDFSPAEAMGGINLHKPTAYDGMPFTQYAASPTSAWGVTEGGVLEAVAPAIDITKATNRTPVPGSSNLQPLHDMFESRWGASGFALSKIHAQARPTFDRAIGSNLSKLLTATDGASARTVLESDTGVSSLVKGPTNQAHEFGSNAGHPQAKQSVVQAVESIEKDGTVEPPAKAKSDADGYASDQKAHTIHQGAPLEAFQKEVYEGPSLAPAAIEAAKLALIEKMKSSGSDSGASDEEKIQVYQGIMRAVGLTSFPDTEDPEKYREQARDKVVSTFGDGQLDQLNALLADMTAIPAPYNRIRGEIWEMWAARVYNFVRPGPFWRSADLDVALQRSKRLADGRFEGDTIAVECKGLSKVRGPSDAEIDQMLDYAKVVGKPAMVYDQNGKPLTSRSFSKVRYYINVVEARPLWQECIESQNLTGVLEVVDVPTADTADELDLDEDLE